MPGMVKIEKRDGYLCCIAVPFDYTAGNLMTFFQAVLEACRDTGENRILVDFTAMRQQTPAALKAMAGILAEQELIHFRRTYGRTPRIAVYGSAPHVSTYKPTQEILRNAGMSFTVTTNEAEAKEWLLSEVQ